ncbi:O-methyltransferase [Flindersiella endophytica]
MLNEPAVTAILDDLHQAARRDWQQIHKVLPRFVFSKLTGRSLMRSLTPAMLRDMYIPVSRQDGRLLYGLARGMGARHVVEFGTSFGISTIYLAAAVRDNGGGRVETTEIEPAKCREAAANLRRAGLDDLTEVLEGDALQTLKTVDEPIDLLFLDGWKDLYLAVLELLKPRLRPGALIIADNVNLADTKPYLTRVRTDPDFFSTLLPGQRMECSWYLKDRPKSSISEEG